MPAQILPLIDDSHSYMEQQRFLQDQQQADQQSQYQQQQLQMRQAEFQAEQQLAPLRQQMLEAEIAKSQQGFDLAAQEWQRQKDIMPDEDKIRKSRVSQSDSDAKRSATEAGVSSDTAASRVQESKNSAAESGVRLARESFGLQRDVTNAPAISSTLESNAKHAQFMSDHDFVNQLMEEETHKLAQATGQQVMDQRAKDFIYTKAANVMSIADARHSPEERKPGLDVLLESGQISQERYDQILNAPTDHKNYVGLVEKELGEEAAAMYEHLSEEAGKRTTSTDVIAMSKSKTSGFALPEDKAWTEATAILKEALAAKDTRETTKRQLMKAIGPKVGDPFTPAGMHKAAIDTANTIVHNTGMAPDGTRLYLLSNGKSVDIQGRERDPESGKVKRGGK